MSNKCKILLHYYVFQKNIKQYLTDWDGKTDGYRKEKGYIIEPDWIKEWKRIVDYDNIKTNYLDHFNIESTKIDSDQGILFSQHLEPAIKDYEEDLIYCVEGNDFLVYDTFLSLEYLQNFCNETIYQLLKTNGRIEKVEYIFKKKMVIIFFKVKKMIKVILFNEMINKIINMKYIFNDNYMYKKEVYYYEKNNSDTIIEKLKGEEVFNKNKEEFVKNKDNTPIYTVSYEEEININNNNTIFNNGICNTPFNNFNFCNNNFYNTCCNFNISNNSFIGGNNANIIGNIPNSKTCFFSNISNNNNTNISDNNSNNNEHNYTNINNIPNSNNDNSNKNNTNDDTNNSNNELNNNNTQSENSVETPMGQNSNQYDKPNLNRLRAQSFLESNNIIAVHFNSTDNKISRSIACQKESIFKITENKLYNEFPGIKNDVSCFIVNGNPIDREKSFEDNNIKDGDNIIICFKDYDTPV